jgi:hypothetical protein
VISRFFQGHHDFPVELEAKQLIKHHKIDAIFHKICKSSGGASHSKAAGYSK